MFEKKLFLLISLNDTELCCYFHYELHKTKQLVNKHAKRTFRQLNSCN